MWEKFIDRWIGPNMFGGYLYPSKANKLRAVWNCVLSYSLHGIIFMYVISLVLDIAGQI